MLVHSLPSVICSILNHLFTPDHWRCSEGASTNPNEQCSSSDWGNQRSAATVLKKEKYPMHYLIQNARAIYRSSDTAPVSDIRIRDGLIRELGNDLIPLSDETLIDASGCVIYPGMVNTHHHLFQSVLKGVPEGLNHGLDEWLASVPFRFWPDIRPELMYHAARLGLFELLRSGATTCADHHYLYHAGTSQEMEDAVWQAADELGIRLVLCRGSSTTKEVTPRDAIHSH
ncbi:amidohydrolase family protein [Vibrio sp. PP-XX7]